MVVIPRLSAKADTRDRLLDVAHGFQVPLRQHFTNRLSSFEDRGNFRTGVGNRLSYRTLPVERKPMASQTLVASASLRRAAQYVRMSTDMQQYSIANQSAAIALYAAAHGFGIVRSFVDAGKSGTTIARRDALKDLIKTVEEGKADFEIILVYDVSRWGRFPDADEAAHYEFLCKKAGVQVRYCAEQFENDNSPTSNLLKALKRMMAGEYSRELAVKVGISQSRLASLGFWQGGPTPFALRRQVIDKNGNPQRILGCGERKGGGNSDRTILIPGAKREVAAVRLVFRLFTTKYPRLGRLRDVLNGPLNPCPGKTWTISSLFCILRNPAYVGANIYCRKARNRKGWKPKEDWVVRDQAFQAIIPTAQFNASQELLKARERVTNEEMLQHLVRLLRKYGKLTSGLIDRSMVVGSSQKYIYRFGSLAKAYELVGFTAKNRYQDVSIIQIQRLRQQLFEEISTQLEQVGAVLTLPKWLMRLMLVNEQIVVRLSFAPARGSATGETFWKLLNVRTKADITIFVRLRAGEHSILDYFVVPRLARIWGAFIVGERQCPPYLAKYHVDNLDGLIEALGRNTLPEEIWNT